MALPPNILGPNDEKAASLQYSYEISESYGTFHGG